MDASEAVNDDDLLKYYPPTTPGWLILLEAAKAMVSGNISIDDSNELRIQLAARRNEYIPLAYLAEIVVTIKAVACKLQNTSWPTECVEFIHSQIGAKAFMILLEGSDYTLVKCPCGECNGYYVITLL